MNTFKYAAIAGALVLAGCSQEASNNKQQPQQETAAVAEAKQSNPFFAEWNTPYGVAPFEQIKDEHYRPAFDKAIAGQLSEIDAIANDTSEATFANTIEAMEKTGDLLDKVAGVFYALRGAHTNDERNAIAKEMSPRLSKLSDDINLNDKLFVRVKAVYDKKDELGLKPNQMTLLDNTYKSFVRGGANLNDADKDKLRELNKKLSELSVQFGENLLNETNSWEMVIDNKEDLAGLSQSIIDAAAATAKERGHEGKWVFTTHRPSKNPFLSQSANRELRERIFKGYTERANNNNANDNKAIGAEMASLRYQRAQLLGYKTHAHYVLENATAKTPENVFKLLNQIWPASLQKAKDEVAVMQQVIDQEGGDFKLEAWDWWHYAGKIRKAKYDLDMEKTKPYFSVEDTLKGVFYTADKLWGVSFKQRDDIPKYHPDVQTYEVFDKDGSKVGIYMYDPYVRASKRGGAWMNSMRKQYRMYGEDVLPIIYNVTNFPAPVGDTPSLLTFDQASTLFHEFGHAIQGLLSDGYYRSLTGTALPRDYVEYPSQVMENWMMEPEVLSQFAKHYKTGEVIPQEMIEKIQAAGKFNQGFGTTEYMAAALLDMKWHSLETAEVQDTASFEKAALDEMGLIKEIAPRYRSTYFAHIFAGGYSSGYYGYIWSNIYDADTWEIFKEKGIFDQATAAGYRKHVLSSGGSEDPAKMYQRFSGREPSIEPLLRRRGLIE